MGTASARRLAVLRRPFLRRVLCPMVCALALLRPELSRGGQSTSDRPVVRIARVTEPPELVDFLADASRHEAASRLSKIEGFVQRVPRDGAPSSQQTEVYLGYDEESLYAVFVCRDVEPAEVRARLMKRGTDVLVDDLVSIQLDTFLDRRRAYVFTTNPLGIQLDAVWVEGSGFDFAYDTLWYSDGVLTEWGYVVWMAIPFASLRFPGVEEQRWGLLLARDVVRLNEQTFWPHYSSRVEGRLHQMAVLEGLSGISGGRKTQIIPYTSLRSHRSAAARTLPAVVDTSWDGGVDFKTVFDDRLVLDVTVNPDFSEVESDAPQVTANERFEVFFPEKRPFFLENADFFHTPVNLVFTRRIVEPRLGARLTGKLGPYAVGALFVDDDSARRGRAITGANAHDTFGSFRLSRDVLGQSTLGFIYAERSGEGESNRVGGVDGRLKLGRNWVASFQGVQSKTTFLDGGERRGPAYELALLRAGRRFGYDLRYSDRAPGFTTSMGFEPRSDFRAVRHRLRYDFWPGGTVLSWGPRLDVDHAWDESGLRLDALYAPALFVELPRQTTFHAQWIFKVERLRPADFAALAENAAFEQRQSVLSIDTAVIPQLSMGVDLRLGGAINFVPPEGEPPFLARQRELALTLTLRPVTALSIENSYLFRGLRERGRPGRIFDGHIFHSKGNWQLTRELSARWIVRFDALSPRARLTSLEERRSLDADFLLTYLVNPWTAIFVGYNTSFDELRYPGAPFERRHRLVPSDRQFFVKASYLFRF